MSGSAEGTAAPSRRKLATKSGSGRSRAPRRAGAGRILRALRGLPGGAGRRAASPAEPGGGPRSPGAAEPPAAGEATLPARPVLGVGWLFAPFLATLLLARPSPTASALLALALLAAMPPRRSLREALVLALALACLLVQFRFLAPDGSFRVAAGAAAALAAAALLRRTARGALVVAVLVAFGLAVLPVLAFLGDLVAADGVGGLARLDPWRAAAPPPPREVVVALPGQDWAPPPRVEPWPLWPGSPRRPLALALGAFGLAAAVLVAGARRFRSPAAFLLLVVTAAAPRLVAPRPLVLDLVPAAASEPAFRLTLDADALPWPADAAGGATGPVRVAWDPRFAQPPPAVRAAALDGAERARLELVAAAIAAGGEPSADGWTAWERRDPLHPARGAGPAAERVLLAWYADHDRPPPGPVTWGALGGGDHLVRVLGAARGGGAGGRR